MNVKNFAVVICILFASCSNKNTDVAVTGVISANFETGVFIPCKSNFEIGNFIPKKDRIWLENLSNKDWSKVKPKLKEDPECAGKFGCFSSVYVSGIATFERKTFLGRLGGGYGHMGEYTRRVIFKSIDPLPEQKCPS